MIYKFSITLLVLVVAAEKCHCAEKISYSGYALYRCSPETTGQVQKLRELMSTSVDGIEFWREPSNVNQTVDIMSSPDEQDGLRDKLRIWRIPTKKIMHDVGRVIERTSVRKIPLESATYRDAANASRQSNLLDAKFFHASYHPYSNIEMKLWDLVNDPKVSLEVAGHSYERRPIYLAKVSKDPAANKPVIFIDAGHHAREWISHATLLYIMESLVNENMPIKFQRPMMKSSSVLENQVEEKALNEGLSAALDKYDFWFVPVVNPDGYEHTHSRDRLWRKTRSRNGMCSGVDPNRNYPYHWREAGSSSFSCDEIYAGPRALSEPETALLAKILEENGKRIVMYLTLHAYSQLFLAPYGYGQVYPENYSELSRVAFAGMKALSSVRGTQYRFGTSSIILYPAAGGSDDFAHGTANIKLAYTIELPDKGAKGFLLPPEEIIPVGQETVVGIKAMIDAIRK